MQCARYTKQVVSAELVYSEGEYWHYSEKGIASYKEWRHGMPPQWYPTHSTAYYIGVTDGVLLKYPALECPVRWSVISKGITSIIILLQLKSRFSHKRRRHGPDGQKQRYSWL